MTTEDPAKLSKKLVDIWESFVLNGKLPEKSIRTVVSESWKRCSTYGVSPRLQKAHTVLSEETLYKIRIESELSEAARPIMDDLAQIVAGTKHIVFLCNAQGQIVEVVGDADVRYKASINNLIVGADWSEERAGTNAIGTAIKHQGPVQIFSAEHYCEGWHGWTCSATPIHDPVSKQVIGVLDFTGSWSSYQPHTLALVVSQAKAIEKSLFENELVRQLKLTNKYIDTCGESATDGILVVDLHGRVIRLNEMAGKQLGIDPTRVIGQTLSQYPELSNAISEIIQYREPNREFESLVIDGRLQHELRLIGKPVVENDKLLGALITLPAISLFGRSGGAYKEFQKTLIKDEYTLDIDVPNNKVKRTGKVVFRATGVEPKSNAAHYKFSSILGNNELFLKSIEMAKRAALNEATVLVLGESGTGKELVAQAIHLASRRSAGPFIAINCGALPKDLVGSELFGYADGAFTGASKGGNPGKFELAIGGTIFLDEIGEMPLEQQVNLLRILQEKEVVRIGGQKTIPIDVRVISASNKNLIEQVRKGNFRQDLYYRLNVISINMPPLRERRDDISLLVACFLEKARIELNKPDLQINSDALQLLEAYSWPGNVRELRNVIERTVQMNWSDHISSESLPSELFEKVESKLNSSFIEDENQPTVDLSIMDRVERDLLLKTVKQCNDNMTMAAAQLKMARSTLYRKLKRLGCI